MSRARPAQGAWAHLAAVTAALLTCACLGSTIDSVSTKAQTPGPGSSGTADAGGTDPGEVPSGDGDQGDSAGDAGTGGNSPPPFTVVGRYIKAPGDGVLARFAWPGVALGFAFEGTGLRVQLGEVPRIFMGNSGHAYFDVEVDGMLRGSVHSTQATPAEVSVIEDLPAGEHTVWLRKRTEGVIGSSLFAGASLSAGGRWRPAPAPKARRLMTWGSSADTGYGVDDRDCPGYKDAEQNQNKAWPQLAANALGAEVHNLSSSGKGIVSNFSPTDDPLLTSPKCVPIADLNVPSSRWDAGNYVPEAVVINLGRNDMFDLVRSPGSAPPPMAAFVQAFVGMLTQISQSAPQARIYLVLNPLVEAVIRPTLKRYLQEVITHAANAGLGNIGFIEMPAYTGDTSHLCNYHPNAAIHQSMADQVVAVLRRDLGW